MQNRLAARINVETQLELLFVVNVLQCERLLTLNFVQNDPIKYRETEFSNESIRLNSRIQIIVDFKESGASLLCAASFLQQLLALVNPGLVRVCLPQQSFKDFIQRERELLYKSMILNIEVAGHVVVELCISDKLEVSLTLYLFMSMTDIEYTVDPTKCDDADMVFIDEHHP